nr:caspase family protein [Bacteroidota bacterium]
MKYTCHFLLFQFLLLLPGLTDAQQRGFQQINLTVNGQATSLYSGSHALVIGVSDYTNGWSDLYGVKSDVNRVKAALEKQGFNVVLIEDPTNVELKAAFDSFISKYGRLLNNRLLVYFSGHGYTMKKGWGGDMGYIVPSDAPDPNKNPDGFKDKALDMESMEV